MPREVEIWQDSCKARVKQPGHRGRQGLSDCEAAGFKARFAGACYR